MILVLSYLELDEIEKVFHFIPPYGVAENHSWLYSPTTHAKYTKKWPQNVIWPMLILKLPS